MNEKENTQSNDMVFLNRDNSKFVLLGDSFLQLEYGSKIYERVTLSRAMPFSDPDSYIIVKGDDGEIGIIRHINDFENNEKEIILKHLGMRYYCPKITEIVSLKDKFGFIYVTVETDSGQKNFASADLTKSIKRIVGDRYIIVDVEGNRFLIEELTKVKNYKKIMAYIV